jgi:hypothetical protein
MISSKKVEEYENQLEMESFNAWQQLIVKGLLKKGTSFSKYKKDLGLVSTKPQKIDKSNKAEAVKACGSIVERLQEAKNGGKKNI